MASPSCLRSACAGADAGEAEGRAVAEEDFGEALADDGGDAPPLQGLRGVFAGGAAAEVAAGDEDLRPLEPRVVERMVRILLAVVLERVLAQAVEGHATQKACGNDSIGVDVVEEKRDAGAGDAVRCA